MENSTPETKKNAIAGVSIFWMLAKLNPIHQKVFSQVRNTTLFELGRTLMFYPDLFKLEDLTVSELSAFENYYQKLKEMVKNQDIDYMSPKELEIMAFLDDLSKEFQAQRIKLTDIPAEGEKASNESVSTGTIDKQ